jgi:Lanthionine synthetase C-like protein
MLYDPARHEPLRPIPWEESVARAAIERIVSDTEAQFSEDRYWPLHPQDRQHGDVATQFESVLYDGACGVIWALHYLQSVGAATLSRNYISAMGNLLVARRATAGASAAQDRASFLLGDTPMLMMAFADAPSGEREQALDALIDGNIDHPARELMLGAPGTMLAALFLHERTGKQRWADLFRHSADKLWSQLEWSSHYQCSFWTQEIFGGQSNYLDAVHGFVGNALPLIRGRHLLGADAWRAWERCIVETVQRTAERQGAHANWRPQLDAARDPKRLLQLCHGAPGFVTCLAELPVPDLDDLLLAAGEITWAAGPLTKGSNLCHGTGGNGYAFLKLFKRTGESRWLERARSFAMHSIVQAEDDARRHGQLRYSLWTGDLGLAVFLHDCLRAQAAFPTLDVFFTAPGPHEP